MARPDSAALGGFYPTPPTMLAPIGGLLALDRPWTVEHTKNYTSFDRSIGVVDPCAADGTAVFGVVDAMLAGADAEPVKFYLAEMEKGRHYALGQSVWKRGAKVRERSSILHGDAFRVRWERRYGCKGASLLFLNPPYDTDPRYKRLEERWLGRFTDVLAFGGVLVFVVPYYALGASAHTLASHYEGLRCYRFPAPEFDAFKQVVLLARRRASLIAPDARVLSQVEKWGSNPDAMPVLPAAPRPVMAVPSFAKDEAGFPMSSGWHLAPLDVDTIAADWQPWRMSGKGLGAVARRKKNIVEMGGTADELRLIPGVLPENGVDGMKAQTFSVAMPLGPGHVASAVACNVFDGIVLDPDDPASGLPRILLAARFRRNWVVTNERVNAKGEKTAEEQVQAPSLVMVALDLGRGTYHRMANSVERRSSTDLSRMTTADLIAAYSRSLLETLRAQCPALHDPDNPAEGSALPVMARPLFPAQAEVVLGVKRLLETIGSALVLGETGTGKTTVATAVMVARDARRVLVICPPHLLDTWRDEVTANYPAAQIVVLDDIGDAEAFATAEVPEGGLRVGVLAETSGKLSHAWAGVGDTSGDAAPVHVEVAEVAGTEERAHRAAFAGGATQPGRWYARVHRCPRCGAGCSMGAPDMAKQRARCEARPLVPTRHVGRLALELAEALLPFAPDNARVVDFCRGPGFLRLIQHWTRESADPRQECARRERTWTELLTSGRLASLAWRLSWPLREGKRNEMVHGAVGRLLVALADDALTARIAGAVYRASLAKGLETHEAAQLRDDARLFMLLMRPGSDAQTALAIELFGVAEDPRQFGESPWVTFADKITTLLGERTLSWKSDVTWGSTQAKRTGTSVVHYTPERGARGGFQRGAPAAALDALERLAILGGVGLGLECGEPLFQAIPRPRRVPISRYLAHRHWEAVDLVIVDEIHEVGDPTSAITRSMMQWRGKAMLGLTGSVSNGKASSLFAILHTMLPAFRAEFGEVPHGAQRKGEARARELEGLTAFVDKYGFRRRVVEERDQRTKAPVIFGSQSDRVEQVARDTGDAPGALPSLILRYVLAISTILHLEDLCVFLPPLVETVETVDPGEPLGRDVRGLRRKLVEQIKRDLYTPLAGKLFGQMSEEWSSADRASLGIGNTEGGVYNVCYPESVGGHLVAALPARPADEVLPKERRLLEIVARELGEGRNVLIFAWHAHCGLYERLACLVTEATGEPCPILDTNKVTAKKRDAWLAREIVGKGRRLMIVNPAAVETGFNKLTHFSTVVWFQPPGCNPKSERQAKGRIRRPGQTKEQRIYWLLYGGTSQRCLHQLLLHKVGESMAVDGLDPTATLRASGVGVAEGMTGFDVGRELFRMAREELGLAE